MPAHKPRYLMGVGEPEDLVNAVLRGVDIFDCVAPTRLARHGTAYVRGGRLNLRNAAHTRDAAPIAADCGCYTCQHFSRAYLRHLFTVGEMLGPILLSVHNIRHFQRLMLDVRRAVRENGWSSLERDWPVLSDPVAGSAEAGPARSR